MLEAAMQTLTIFGACKDQGVIFDGGPTREDEAKAICNDCEVIKTCREVAVIIDSIGREDLKRMVWAGMNQQERKQFVRRLRIEQRNKVVT